MLIYNSKKEFVGIDRYELDALGFTNLSELRAESADFADMFVRVPGYIHNFKYVHWIDYITYGGTSNPKAIISAKGKNYYCNILISTAYLTDYPASEAYIVNLQNIRELTQDEVDEIQEDLAKKQKPIAVAKVPTPPKDYAKEEEIKQSIIKQNNLMNNNTLEEISVEDEVQKENNETIKEKSAEIIEEDVEIVEDKAIISNNEKKQTSSTQNNIVYDPNYVFDPHVASDELGLPIDLIEEFIEDFIAQAHEFKADLYKYLDEEDINNVRILSHKLKGVAANLRVEDAFAVLTVVNTSTDLQEIRYNLNLFYKIIAKLSGEDVDMQHIETLPEEDDILELDFKDDDDISNDIIKQKDVQVDEEDDLKLEIVTDSTPKVEFNYNKEKVAKEMGISIDTFNELFEDYINDSLQICNSIKESIASNDSQKWNQQTIQLKGMSENMKVELFKDDLEVLLQTSRQDEAQRAIEHVISIISTMKV